MTVYRIALYIRLSSADEGKGSEESNSVKNQRDLLDNYIASCEEFTGADAQYFIDDGYTGTNFNRPAIGRLIEKAKKGMINCIIVKDFSRFGRNYIEVGDYLDRYFPFLGVRFISVNDHYDSNNNIGNTAGLDVAFKTIIHSLYSKDLSKKVRIGQRAKAEKGIHLCGLAPFGYVKSKTEKSKLLIDEQAASVVRSIFDMALSGMTNTDIAKKLNNNKVDSPLVYRRKNGVAQDRGWNVKCETNLWTIHNVSRVLHDERYTGKLVSGKRTQIAPLHKKTKPVPKEDWIVAENAHEGIITQEVFDEVQRHSRKGSYINTANKQRLFAHKLFCGYCGYALMYCPAIKPYYRCKADRNGYSTKRCFDEKVYEDLVEEALILSLKSQVEEALILKTKLTEQEIRGKQMSDDVAAQLKKLSGRIAFLDMRKTELFKEYVDGRISKEKFIEAKEECFCEAEQAKRQAAELESKMAESVLCPQDVFDLWGLDERMGSATEVTEEMLSLVKCIHVFGGKQIEVQFAFRGDMEKATSLLD